MADAHATPRAPRSHAARLLRAAGSLRLGVVLLVLIAAASTVGIVLPQPESFKPSDYLSKRLDPASEKALEPDALARLARAAGILARDETVETLTSRARDGALGELECLRLFYVDSYGPALGRVLLAVRAHTLFRSAWFRVLCGLLVVNLAACSAQRLGGQWRAAFGLRAGTEPGWYERRGVHASATRRPDVDATLAAVDAALRAEGFRVHRRRATGWATVEATRSWLGQLGRLWWPLGRLAGLGRLGSQVVHLGVVLVLIGGFVSGQLAFRHPQPLEPGQVVAVPDLSATPKHAAQRLATSDWREGAGPRPGPVAFRLRLRRFEVRFDRRGKPEYYGAHVALPDATPPVDQVIEVNRPLVYRGYYVYQQSYQTDYRRLSGVSLTVEKVRAAPDVRRDAHGRHPPAHVLERFQVAAAPDVPLAVPGTGLSLRVLRYFSHWLIPFEQTPDGRMTVGEAQNTSQRFNPAIQVRLEAPGRQPLVRWMPLPFRPGEPRRGSTVAYGDFRITPHDFRPAYNTVLEFKTHPVLWPVWLGCGAMMAGIVLCFYCNHERVWALVRTRDDGGSQLWLAGNAFKWRERFKQRFDAVVAALGDGGPAPRGGC